MPMMRMLRLSKARRTAAEKLSAKAECLACVLFMSNTLPLFRCRVQVLFQPFYIHDGDAPYASHEASTPSALAKRSTTPRAGSVRPVS